MSLKALEEQIAGNISAEKDRLKRECESIRKEMKAEKTAHDQTITKDKQSFEEYKGECNLDIARKKKHLEDSINELASIEDNQKKLEQENDHVDKRKVAIKAQEQAVEDAKLSAAQAEERAKKKEELFNKKLSDLE